MQGKTARCLVISPNMKLYHIHNPAAQYSRVFIASRINSKLLLLVCRPELTCSLSTFLTSSYSPLCTPLNTPVLRVFSKRSYVRGRRFSAGLPQFSCLQRLAGFVRDSLQGSFEVSSLSRQSSTGEAGLLPVLRALTSLSCNEIHPTRRPHLP